MCVDESEQWLDSLLVYGIIPAFAPSLGEDHAMALKHTEIVGDKALLESGSFAELSYVQLAAFSESVYDT